MRKRKHSVLADFSFQGILILMFIAIIFLAFDHENLAVNGILLCITLLMFMVTYFTTIRTGLIIDSAFIFLLISYVVLQSVNTGANVKTNTYFWIFWPMGMIIAISCYVRQYHLLDKQNEELVSRIERYVTIDELTQMNNLLGFERDAAVYMNISRRYKLELELVLWRLTYQENLEQLLDSEDMQTAIGIISDSINNSLRKEDLVYLVDRKPYIWGTLMFSKPEAAEIVISHVREGVAKGGLGQLISHNNYSLEITGTVMPYNGSMISPLAYLNQAKRQLWYEEENGTQKVSKKKERYKANSQEQTAAAKTDDTVKAEGVIKVEDAVKAESTVKAEDAVKAEDTIKAEDAVKAEATVKTDDSVKKNSVRVKKTSVKPSRRTAQKKLTLSENIRKAFGHKTAHKSDMKDRRHNVQKSRRK